MSKSKEKLAEDYNSGDLPKKIKLFEQKQVRTVWDEENEKWWFSVVDIVATLTDKDYQGARKYWKVLKGRLISEGNEAVTNCYQLKLLAPDGKMRLTDVADTEQILRLIQSIPSKKAEPFKLWLAKVGNERIDETVDPEQSIERAIQNYRRLGYSENWINQRIKSIEVRKALTDEWDKGGVEQGAEYAALTDLMSRTWSGMTTREYKKHKDLKKENLRDNMTNTELVLSSLGAGGYIWHTTGSGKTLTSFKAAQLATKLEGVEKVLFVVDRKDLDYQTMKEYDRFEKGAANSNTSTAVLKKQLEDPQAKIIITTIQKLSGFVKQNQGHAIYEGHIVIIFDECHRSQFGDMHTAITKAFNNYHLFGFTGTPIFAVNAGAGGNPQLKTTEQAFGDKLHTYTIVDAISDKNVLPFRIDFIDTVKTGDDIKDKQVSAIDRERVLLAPERISQIAGYVLEHFTQKTKRNHSYTLKDQRLYGFNSLFATQSINAAKLYYAELKRLQAALAGEKLKIALIYSFAPNEDEPDGFLAEEQFEVSGLDQSSRDFLDIAIDDYNELFATNYDTSADKFQNYYKDLSERIKKREVDLVIVANMFLTGFDATTLNTLWVDKNLRQHGLIQAFSRTNRILNSVKTFGNIVCFRNLEQETNDAIALFGNKDAAGIVLLKPYDEYYGEYEQRIAELAQRYPLGEVIVGEEAQKEFIKHYGSILRLKNILSSFDDFVGDEILSERDFQDYQSVYINLYQEWRRQAEGDKEIINDDVVFEIELIKQVEINIDYILMLVKKYHSGNCKDKEVLVSIDRAVSASLSLRNKKDLIEQFVSSLTVAAHVDEEWKRFMQAKKAEELSTIIAEENLNSQETFSFIENAFRDGALQESGTAIIAILPPVSRFSAGQGHSGKKQAVIEKLRAFFERFFGM